MKLKVKEVGLSSGGPLIIVLNVGDAKDLDLNPGDRVSVKRIKLKREVICVVNISEKGIKKGEIGFFDESLKKANVKKGNSVDVEIADTPRAIEYIKKKLEGGKLNDLELNELVRDIVNNEFSESELTYFVSACYSNGLNLREAAALADAIVVNGEKLEFKDRVIVDKHCLTEDVPVMVKNSGETKVKGIGDIVNGVFDRCTSSEINFDDGAEFTNKNLKNLQVPTFGENGNVEYKKVTGVFRAKSPRFVHVISLKGNREVKVTADHTIFVLKNGNIVNIRAVDLKKGDFVVVPNKLRYNNKIKEIKVKTDYKIRNYRPFNKTIKITPEFVRILAYYISEGFTNYQGVFFNFGSHEEDLINDSIKCVEKVFGFTPTINKPHETATRVCLYSQVLSKIFEKDIKAGIEALNKRIPSFMFDIGNDLKKEFLRTLIKCDGHERRGYEAEYGTSSKELFIQLQYMFSLLGMGISTHVTKESRRVFPNGQECKISESYQIYTQRRELFGNRQRANVAFINLLPIKEIGEIDKSKIGWEFRRALKRQKYITKDKLRIIENFIFSHDIKKIINKDLSVLEIKENKRIKSKSKWVYDLQVRGYDKFIAGTAPMAVHNCIGGIPGNRTTMIVVPIMAALGYKMPKTSSRSITSPSGTADTMEVLAPVSLGVKKLKKIVNKTKGCIVWGGGMNLAAADDKLIKIRHPLRLDPLGMVLASIMAKKKAVGATHVLIDIPFGEGAKIEFKKEALDLKKQFIKMGKLMGMKVRVILTDGTQPIGNGIGPALECSDVISVLKGKGPHDLREKSIFLCIEILKMLRVSRAKKKVLKVLENGKAYEKFKEIIKAQGGKKRFVVPRAKLFYDVKAGKSGKVVEIRNKVVSKLARLSGSPEDRAAGMYLRVDRGDEVKRGEILFTLYAESEIKLDTAKNYLKRVKPILY